MNVNTGFIMKFRNGVSGAKAKVLTWLPAKGYRDGTLNVHASATSSTSVTAGVTVLQFKALYIGGDGNLTVRYDDDTTQEYIGLLAGTILPVTGNGVTAMTTTNVVAMNW